MGFTETEYLEIWKIVAAILMMSNLQFKEMGGGETADVSNTNLLNQIAGLLGVSPKNLKDGFMTSKITVGSEVIFKELNMEAVG